MNSRRMPLGTKVSLSEVLYPISLASLGIALKIMLLKLAARILSYVAFWGEPLRYTSYSSSVIQLKVILAEPMLSADRR